MIRKFIDFINEAKLFIYNRKFRVDDLIDSNIYSEELVRKWQKEYDFDDLAHCMFVTKTKSKSTSGYNLRVSSVDIKNKFTFDTDSKRFVGYLPEDSKLINNGDEVFLYIFKRNSNISNRSRQIHGFIYESEVKRLNGLKKLSRTHKWDAVGNLDKKYLEFRTDDEKTVEFFDGSKYINLTNPLGEVDWEKVPEDFKSTMNWSIKCMGKGSDIEMGDFKRISGLEKKSDSEKSEEERKMPEPSLKMSDSGIEHFMLSIGLHNKQADKKVLEEYIIFMPISQWQTYLPNIKNNIDQFSQMYRELVEHRLKGESSYESEENWQNYMKKYKKLTDKSPIKLRFKRDSKGQLRIQSAFSYSNLMNLILKNKHIRIT